MPIVLKSKVNPEIRDILRFADERFVLQSNPLGAFGLGLPEPGGRGPLPPR